MSDQRVNTPIIILHLTESTKIHDPTHMLKTNWRPASTSLIHRAQDVHITLAVTKCSVHNRDCESCLEWNQMETSPTSAHWMSAAPWWSPRRRTTIRTQIYTPHVPSVKSVLWRPMLPINLAHCLAVIIFKTSFANKPTWLNLLFPHGCRTLQEESCAFL